MGSELYSTGTSGHGTSGKFARFQQFLSYLLGHPDESPFNPSKLAEILHIPIDLIAEYFQAIHHTFELFKTLEQQHNFKWEHVVERASETESIKTLIISLEDMQNFSDLVYLAAKIPLKMSSVSSNVSFQRLIENYPSFFDARKNQWRISTAGLFFAKQFKAFKKLNSVPDQLEYEDLILKII